MQTAAGGEGLVVRDMRRGHGAKQPAWGPLAGRMLRGMIRRYSLKEISVLAAATACSCSGLRCGGGGGNGKVDGLQ